MTSPRTDEITEEAIARKHDHDPRTLADALRQRERTSGRRVVELSTRKQGSDPAGQP